MMSSSMDPLTGMAFGLNREPNDTLAQATRPRFFSTPEGKSTFIEGAAIGNNTSLADPTTDVDLFKVRLRPGDNLTVDVEAQEIGSSLDSVVRIFNPQAVEVAFNDDFNSLDSFIEYTVPSRGTYYIGVSGYDNSFYDPVTGAGTISGSTGNYNLFIDVT